MLDSFHLSEVSAAMIRLFSTTVQKLDATHIKSACGATLVGDVDQRFLAL